VAAWCDEFNFKAGGREGTGADEIFPPPLLPGGESISAEMKQALREDRVKDAAHILIVEYGLMEA